MGSYIVRRLLQAILTLLLISFVVFAILDLAPGDPTAQMPGSISAEVQERIRRSLGLDQPFHIRYLKWLQQFLINEPLNLVESVSGIKIGDSANRLRVRSWGTRSPVVDLLVERLPQTLIVMGSGYFLSILIAVPIGVISAYKQYSAFDQIGTFIAMVGFSWPTFFTGLLAIYIFSVKLEWFPSFYDTTHQVVDFSSLLVQIKQSIMPVSILAFAFSAQFTRYVRSSMLENLQLDYVRTARAKGLRERTVLGTHVLRNSLIPVVTLIALGIPRIITGGVITEQVFGVNGIGQLLIFGIKNTDIPLVQTVTFLFGVLTVVFNIVADVMYVILDPRIRYD